ncbi:hypothetical protein Tco_1109988 [Tanacetum coccineum]|uniref:Uncharacterized protein n=1 Tax=Tanacetum coccineum TaxID=301880 RepID=A0ABQ5IIZ5_9ASTR
MVVDRGVSCGGQSVFIYVVVVVVADHGCEVMEGQVVLVVVSSSGACDEEWWSCFGDFLFNFLVVVKDGDDKSFWPLVQQAEGQPVNMDNASIIATFPADLRHEAITTSTAPCERPSAETLFELICTWLHKGNYCESATEHDQPETEGPVGRLTKRNLHRLYGCQSNVVYGRSQLIDGLPPQVLHQILEILNYLATNHSCVADILFYFNSTRGLESLNTGIYDMNDKGKEKVLEGEEIPQPDGLSIECIVHEALESPQYRSSGAERMHDGLVVRPMPTAPTPPVLEVTVSRPLDPICRIASQPRAPEPPYAPPPPPPLPTLHGVVSPPPLQDVEPSLQPPPPPPMYEALLHLKYQHLLCKLFPHHLHDHLRFLLIHLQSMLNQLHHLLLIPSSWS